MTTAVIEYRAVDWTPIPVFDCQVLRAALTTAACGARWLGAQSGTACTGCEIGRRHHAETHPQLKVKPTFSRPSACLRCGRTDQRLIGACICVGCYNRQAEWLKGRNAKGRPPGAYQALHRHMVGIEAAGVRSWRCFMARHAAEALGRISRCHLPPGAKITPDRLGTPGWNDERQQFEYLDPGTGQFLLERERSSSGLLEFICRGSEAGTGWRAAVVRSPVSVMTVAEALDLAAGLEGAPTWTHTAHVCSSCQRSPIEVRRREGTWEARCPECGARHESAPR